MSCKILIVDDEQPIRSSLKGVLEDEGHEVCEAPGGEQAFALLESEQPDLIFLDIWLPGLDGLAILERIRQMGLPTPVIMISGHGNIETAVQAIKKGAFDFIEKPLSLEKVIICANKALEMVMLRRENEALRSRIGLAPTVRLTGESPGIAALREAITQVAPTDAWVLITGENGTGKEIVARSIHRESRRGDKPLVEVNCAAIPEELIESELFGHEKGAFTGADKAQAGKFELADGGTLFLDEIGDMSLKTQAKILRIIQEQRFERVGGRKTITVDVRVIAATNKDLPAEIRAGAFREDLYYRLKVFPLEVPPLRERNGDIELLIEEFNAAFARQHGFKPVSFTPGAFQALRAHGWPGNVRELKNFVERMIIMHAGKTVDAERLPPEFRSCLQAEAAGDESEEAAIQDALDGGSSDLKQARARFEARFLEAKLRESGGNVSRLAEAVGMDRSALHRKLKSLNIQAD